RSVLRSGSERLWIVCLAEQPRQLIKAPLRTFTPRSGGHLSATRNNLDQSWPDGGTRGPQVDVAEPAVRRGAGAAAQLCESRPDHHGLLKPDVACQAIHQASGRLIMKIPSGRRRNPLRSSTACEATLPSS